MPDLTKIATCSYCGTRSVLRLGGSVQHELACRACGAKLHEMKPLKTSRPAPARRPAPAARPQAPSQKRKPKKRRSKPLFHRLRDVLEDIIDEVEDIFD